MLEQVGDLHVCRATIANNNTPGLVDALQDNGDDNRHPGSFLRRLLARLLKSNHGEFRDRRS
jgi:hypothetical protein